MPPSDRGSEPTVVWRLALGKGETECFVEVGILFLKTYKFQHHTPQPHSLSPKEKTGDAGKYQFFFLSLVVLFITKFWSCL
jgi:hypothetical protein